MSIHTREWQRVAAASILALLGFGTAARLLEPLSMLLLHLEETGEKGRDLALVLGSRTARQAERCPVVSMEVREAG